MKTQTKTFRPDFPVPETFLTGGDVFFDIETTGLGWRRSHLYLIGAAVYHAETDCFEVTQWFADEPARELDLLEAFARFLRPFKRLVHYNGAGFDLPYLRNKYEFYHLEMPFDSMATLDLYQTFRPFRNVFGLSSMKQRSLEVFSGFSREDRFSGEELIGVYEEYLGSGNPELLQALYLHNLEDVTGMVRLLSLWGILALFSGRFRVVKAQVHAADPQNPGDNPACPDSAPALTLGLVPEVPVFHSFQVHTDAFRLLVSPEKTKLTVQGRQGELKFFFPNYKDYYYLPLEDAAIHKSVGAYVDAGHREKAKAANCYQRHFGLYFPQPAELLSPAFREDYNAKQLYFQWTEELSLDSDFLFRYASGILSSLVTVPSVLSKTESLKRV